MSCGRGAPFIWVASVSLALALFMGPSAPRALAQEALARIPYADLYPHLAAQAAGKINRLAIRFRIGPAPGKPDPGPVELKIETTGGSVPIAVADGNIFDLPANKIWADENAYLVANKPEQSLSLTVLPTIKNLSQSFRFSELVASAKEFNDYIDDQAGLMSFAAPSAKSVVIRCGADCAATISGLSTGEERLTATADGAIRLKLSKAWIKADPMVVLSHPPSMAVVSTREE